MSRSAAHAAVNSASSYSGSSQPTGAGAANASLRHDATLDVAHEGLKRLAIAAAAEREATFDRGPLPGPDRDDQEVVVQRLAVARPQRASRRIDCGHRGEPKMRIVLVRDRGEVESAHLAEPERLGDRDRPVAKLRLGAQDLDLDRPAELRPEREQGLETGDATTGDEDLRAMMHSLQPGHEASVGLATGRGHRIDYPRNRVVVHSQVAIGF